MAEDDLSKFLQNLKNKSQQMLEGESFQWFMDQIRRMGKITRLRIQELTETVTGRSQERTVETGPVETVRVGDTRVRVPQDAIFDQIASLDALQIGRMVLYQYEPKLKKTLPYYDTYPLVIPVKLINSSRFHGLNLHYLPPYERAQLLTALMTLAEDKNIDEKTKLRISYNILKSSSNYRLYSPCFKEYLSSHVRSTIMVIHPNQWNKVVMLPLAQFKKASTYKVWQDSIKKVYR